MAINANLSSDIKILKLKEVASHFHARFNVKEKVYLYKLEVAKSKQSPLSNELMAYVRKS